VAVPRRRGLSRLGAVRGRFTDGTRVLNYAEWTDEDAHRRMVEADSTPTDDEWKTRISTGTPGVRFTGFTRYHLHHSLTRPQGASGA
jgi:hypothetical protein